MFRTNPEKYQPLANLCETLPAETFHKMLALRRNLTGDQRKHLDEDRAWRDHAKHILLLPELDKYRPR